MNDRKALAPGWAKIRIVLRWVGVSLLIVIVLFCMSLMLPVEAWRTGELPTVSLPVEPGQPFSMKPIRVWIDTDAACGYGRPIDADDCLAILLLAEESNVQIVGISTVFGNAPLSVTDRTTRALAARLEERTRAPVYRGASERVGMSRSAKAIVLQEAHEMLRAALEREPLLILALGPLTNIAIALENRPDLQANVKRLIAVMGRRRGHVFHPIEGATAHSFLGHGPVFRDFNFIQDEAAAAAVLAMGLPVTLIPYEAARYITVGPAVLDRMAGHGGVTAWVAQQARPWLAYWHEDIGLPGFYPFDLIAAAHVVQPQLLYCADVPVAVGDDTWIFGWLGGRGLFVVSPEEPPVNPTVMNRALYCPRVSEHFEMWLLKELAGAHEAVTRVGSRSRRNTVQTPIS